MKRFSRKRQSILDCLKATDTHPGAEWIYAQLKPDHPDLSLGTVYRNLKELERAGEIRSVGVVQDRERYDGRLDPHSHAVCACCGRIFDLNGLSLPEELLAAAQADTDFTVLYPQLQLIGLCAACRDGQESRPKA